MEVYLLTRILVILLFLLGEATSNELCSENDANCILSMKSESLSEDNTVIKRNVLGGALKDCSRSPLTGFFRDGTCFSNEGDFGNHSVCAVMTEEFLNYTLMHGNNLISSNPRYNFPGLRSGDKWCLCAQRWFEAYSNGVKTKIDIKATHERALKVLKIKDLKSAQYKHK